MEDLKVWIADPLVKILPDSPALMADEPHIKIDAVRNEYESGQFVVTPEKDIEKLTVKVSPLKGPSEAVPYVKANFLGYVPITRGTFETPDEYIIAKPPADLPDPILDSDFVSVKARKNQPIWLTVYVPKEAAAGIYNGIITIEADSTSVELPVSVKVYPVDLPDDRTLNITQWFLVENISKSQGVPFLSEGYWPILESFARFMAEYRNNYAFTPIIKLITAKDDGAGNLTFDFSLFDRWIETFIKAGVVGYIEGMHLAGRKSWREEEYKLHLPQITNPDGSLEPHIKLGVSSKEARDYLSQFMRALQEHLEKKGWLDIYFQHLADEPIPLSAESYNNLSRIVREAAPKIKIIDAIECLEVEGSADIYVTQTSRYDENQEFYLKRQRLGDQVWFYTCMGPRGKYMNRFVDYHLIGTRLLHWANFKYNVPGYLHWGFNWYKDNPYTELERDNEVEYLPPGDTHIVYPGTKGLISSIRLEAMRDGIEDYELLKLLEKKDPELARDICNSVVRTLTDYTLDSAEFRKARMRLIDGLSK